MIPPGDVIEFDDATHTYRVGGRVLASVTQILKRNGLIESGWYSQESALRGQYVHEATALLDQGALDESTIDARLGGYIEAYRRFLADVQPVIRAIETRVARPSVPGFGFAGTIDRVAILRDWNSEVIIDLKTGSESPWHRIQTAAYAQAFGTGIVRRACVYLKADGYYRWREHDDILSDTSAWDACIHLFAWRERNHVA